MPAFWTVGLVPRDGEGDFVFTPNINDMFPDRPDYLDVYLLQGDKGHFYNLAFAFVFTFALNLAIIVRRAVSFVAPEVSVRLAPSSQGSALAIFNRRLERDLCLGYFSVE